MIYKRIPNEENSESSLVQLLFDMVWKIGFDKVASVPMNSCHIGDLSLGEPLSHITATSYVAMLFPELIYIRDVSIDSSHECTGTF